MTRKNLADILKATVIGVGIFGAVIYLAAFPLIARELPPLSDSTSLRALWLAFVLTSSLPCYVTLVLLWRAATRISRGELFCLKNAHSLKRISYLAAADSAFVFLGNIALFFTKSSPLALFLVLLFFAFIGIFATVVFAVLSHIVARGCELQEQSDLTI